jgi:hypothetical protein
MESTEEKFSQLNDEERFKLYEPGIKLFLRSSRKAGIATVVFSNCGANSNEGFAEHASNIFACGTEAGSQERRLWHSLILGSISSELIYPIEKVQAMLSEKEWNDISIKGVPECTKRLKEENELLYNENGELKFKCEQLERENNIFRAGLFPFNVIWGFLSRPFKASKS